ncbi:Pentatricopeptide repeat-containing protein At1g74630 [Linum grandiflorum]
MRRDLGLPPDSYSFAFVLKASANLKSLRVGSQLHCQALIFGLDSHLFVGTTLISLYGECACVSSAYKIMYTFMAGIKQDKIIKEAYEKLKEIMLRLRLERGYAPEVGNVLYDIEDEEKEDSISSHSEKLAVAFGIGRLCRGKMIRIVKNLRICKDCHVLMKLISQVYDVEIVVRDRSRFHTFKSGSCSCRDYW